MQYPPAKELHAAWLRSGAVLHNVIQKLEEELARMRAKKIAQEIIDQKDDQIEALVNFYNQTDELLQVYRLTLVNTNFENHFLTEMLLKKCTLGDVMNYKPTAAARIFNTDNGNEHTLTELNG